MKRMAKVTSVTIGASYTYQPAQYHSAKGEASFTIEIDEDDDIDEVMEDARADIVTHIVATLAGVDKVHTGLYIKGNTPEDLLALLRPEEETDNEVLTDDDDDDWDD